MCKRHAHAYVSHICTHYTLHTVKTYRHTPYPHEWLYIHTHNTKALTQICPHVCGYHPYPYLISPLCTRRYTQTWTAMPLTLAHTCTDHHRKEHSYRARCVHTRRNTGSPPHRISKHILRYLPTGAYPLCLYTEHTAPGHTHVPRVGTPATPGTTQHLGIPWVPGVALSFI
jgi:hypothetical protein